MKLKTLIRNFDGTLFIYVGDYEKKTRLCLARIYCNESMGFLIDREYTGATYKAVGTYLGQRINKLYCIQSGSLVAFIDDFE